MLPYVLAALLGLSIINIIKWLRIRRLRVSDFSHLPQDDLVRWRNVKLAGIYCYLGGTLGVLLLGIVVSVGTALSSAVRSVFWNTTWLFYMGLSFLFVAGLVFSAILSRRAKQLEEKLGIENILSYREYKMRSGYDDYGIIWGNPYYDNRVASITDLRFVHKNMIREDVIISIFFPVPQEQLPQDQEMTVLDDGRVEIPYKGQSFDPTKFQLTKSANDHKKCFVCWFSIRENQTYWANRAGQILCDACYEHYTQTRLSLLQNV